MKISKFIWSVLVAFVAVGLVAPQQGEAASMAPPNGLLRFGGNVTLSFDPDTNRFSLDFDSVTVTDGTGSFANFNGTALDLETLTIDAATHQIDPDNEVAEWFVLDGFVFFHPDGKGQVRLGPPTSSVALSFFGINEVSGDFEPHPHWFDQLKGTGTGETIPFSALVVVPDSGSALGLLAIGLVGLVAVEALRRKLATRQNRYA